MISITFEKKRIASQGLLQIIMDKMAAAFKQHLPEEAQAASVAAPTVTQVPVPNLQAALLRRLYDIEFIRAFLVNNGNEYILPPEHFELRPQAYNYYTKFKSEFYENFVSVSDIKIVTTYADTKEVIPHPLLLIHEIIQRIIARILSAEAKTYGMQLIDVLVGFINIFNELHSNQGNRLGLIDLGLATFNNGRGNDQHLTDSGFYLRQQRLKPSIYAEIDTLKQIVNELEELTRYTNVLSELLTAVSIDESSFRRRLIVFLVYLNTPSIKEFPLHLLNEGSLRSGICDLVMQVYKKLLRKDLVKDTHSEPLE